LFLHAGIDLSWFNQKFPIWGEFGDLDIDKLNNMFKMMLGDEQLMSSVLMDSKSPLWTRDFSKLPDDDLCKILLPRIQKKFRVSTFVVGHNADTRNRSVRTRCDGKIILADFAMSKGVNHEKVSYPGVLIFTFSNRQDGNSSIRQISSIQEVHEDRVTSLLSDGLQQHGALHVRAMQSQLPTQDKGNKEVRQVQQDLSQATQQRPSESPQILGIELQMPATEALVPQTQLHSPYTSPVVASGEESTISILETGNSEEKNAIREPITLSVQQLPLKIAEVAQIHTKISSPSLNSDESPIAASRNQVIPIAATPEIVGCEVGCFPGLRRFWRR
jgi:hypothetical protein